MYTSSLSASTSTAGSGDGTFLTVSTVDASLDHTKLVASTMDLEYMENYIPDRVEGAGLYSGNYADSYALELSRQLVAFSASIYEPSLVQSANDYDQMLGSRLEIIPLVLYLVAIFLFSLVTLVIGILSLIAFHSTPFVDLGHKRITSPIPLFYYLFGPVDPRTTWEKDHLNLFLAETENDRLNVGTVDLDGQRVFGVARVHEAEAIVEERVRM